MDDGDGRWACTRTGGDRHQHTTSTSAPGQQDTTTALVVTTPCPTASHTVGLAASPPAAAMSKRKLAPLTLDTPLASMPMSALSYLPEMPEMGRMRASKNVCEREDTQPIHAWQ